MGIPTFELNTTTTLGAYLGTPISSTSFIPLDVSVDWPKSAPVFLDTNVLLGYYQMPINARQRFYPWLVQHQGYASDQVKREFKRHAPTLQRIHRRHLRAPIDLARLADSQGQLKAYLKQQARLLRDYPSWRRALEDLLAEVATVTAQSEQYNQRYLKQGHDLLRQINHNDPFKVLYTLPAIEKREYKHLKREFDQAAVQAIQENNKGFDDAVAAYQYRHPERVFPGLGDVLTKQKNPYGDYLIYHELLKWAARDEGDAPILFLTDDSTKGDWLDARGAPYPHYQQHFKAQTGRLLHIHAARPVLTQWLGRDTTTLLTPIEVQQDVEKAIWTKNAAQAVQLISIPAVKVLLETLFPTRTQEGTVQEWQEVMDYLQEDTHYQSLFQLEGQLLRHYPKIIQQALDSQADDHHLAVLKQCVGMPF